MGKNLEADKHKFRYNLYKTATTTQISSADFLEMHFGRPLADIKKKN